MNPAHDPRRLIIVVLALIALALKVAIAYNTIGTNDAVFFYGFAKVLSQHSLQWTYEHSRYFNHPPLTAYYLRGIFTLTEQAWCQQLGFHFPLLLRLPGIVADFLVVLVLLRLTKRHFAIPNWALGLFALSPVSLMVSGFHGNTDPVMVLLLVCAVWMCLEQQPALAGLFFALSCQIKIVPLLFLPAFVFYWASQQKGCRFLLPTAITTALLWQEPLLHFPVLFAKNVLTYGSYWGIWGITYCIRVSGVPQFSRLSFFDLTSAQNVIITILKMIIIGAAVCMAWRQRHARGRRFVELLGQLWLVFFIFAPGVCPQYLTWLAPLSSSSHRHSTRLFLSQARCSCSRFITLPPAGCHGRWRSRWMNPGSTGQFGRCYHGSPSSPVRPCFGENSALASFVLPGSAKSASRTRD